MLRPNATDSPGGGWGNGSLSVTLFNNSVTLFNNIGTHRNIGSHRFPRSFAHAGPNRFERGSCEFWRCGFW